MKVNSSIHCCSLLLLFIAVIASTCTANNVSSSSLAFVRNKNRISNTQIIPRGGGAAGGAVIECENLADVDAILTKAALNDQLVVIDFTATWCGPCQMVAPVYAQLSEQYEGVVFLKVDVDANSETAMKYAVRAMPTFLLLKKGEVVDTVVGANVQKLEDLIQEYM